MKTINTCLVSIIVLFILTINTHAVTYVSKTGSDISPYDTWEKATPNIESAFSVGGLITISNGTYILTADANLMNIAMMSVNGPDTVIVDCNSYTIDALWVPLIQGISFKNGSGALDISETTVKNCKVYNCTGQAAILMYNDCTVEDCEIYDNQCSGVSMSKNCTLKNCVIRNNNTVVGNGGGVITYISGSVENCLIYSNSAAYEGGGISVYDGSLTIKNCTVADNSAVHGGGIAVESGLSPIINNSIIYDNSSSTGPNYYLIAPVNSSVSDCCTTPSLGTGCITSDPQLTDEYKLLPTSPCIDSGNISGSNLALDGDNNGSSAQDIGCYEYVHPLADSDGDIMLDTWELSMGLDPVIVNGNQDDDGDKVNNVSEYIADTDPLDSDDVFRCKNIISESSITVSWYSSANRTYDIEETLTLNNINWVKVSGHINISGTGTTINRSINSGSNQSYYRIVASTN